MVQRSPALRGIIGPLKCSQIHSSSSLKYNAACYLHTGTAHHCPSSHLLPWKAAQHLIAAQQGNTLTQLLQAFSQYPPYLLAHRLYQAFCSVQAAQASTCRWSCVHAAPGLPAARPAASLLHQRHNTHVWRLLTTRRQLPAAHRFRCSPPTRCSAEARVAVFPAGKRQARLCQDPP